MKDAVKSKVMVLCIWINLWDFLMYCCHQ